MICFDFKQSMVLLSVVVAFLLVPGGLYHLKILFRTTTIQTPFFD